MPAATAPVAIAIDRIPCDGFGMSAELLPELIRFDDWGYPIVAAGAVPDALLEYAERAAAVCPVLAIRLRGLVAAPTAAQAAPTEASRGLR